MENHEARLMTLEEVVAIMKDEKNFVWVEGWQGEDEYWLPDRCINDFGRIDTDYYEGNFMIFEFGNEVWNDMPPKNYNKTWRCWTSMPTNEQIAAEPALYIKTK